MKTPKSLDSRHLYVDSLARKLEALESGRQPMHALTYRVHTRMLRRALQAQPEASFNSHAVEVWGVMEEALDNLCFEADGFLPTVRGREIKQQADALIARCQRNAATRR